MEKTRVLEIIGKRPVGGVGTVLLNYQQHINSQNVQMDYLIFGEAPESFDEKVKAMGSKVYMYPRLSGRHMTATKRQLEDFFRSHQGEYEIVHLHAPNLAFLCFPIAKKYGVTRRIVHSHATVYAESAGKAFRNKILWGMAKKSATTCIACSKAAGEFLFPGSSYVVMKNAIVPERYTFSPEIREQVRQQEEKEAFILGNVGRFSPQKNQGFLLDIFACVYAKNQKARLWLIGDGELRLELEQRVKELQLESVVRFFGMVERPMEFYQGMDVMVMPSLFEGLPMVGVEAQMSGLPCVFSDTITREVAIAPCTYVSLQESPQVWAEKINQLVLELPKRQSYGEKIKELGFDIEEEAGRLEMLYVKGDCQ